MILYILLTHPNTKLLIVGEGVYLEDLKGLAHQLDAQDNVIFTGHITNEEIFSFYNASEIFILPTLRQEEMPFSLLEAMACGKPVIASKIGGISSVIDDGVNGFLVPPGKISKLVEKTISLLNNKNFADKLADNARKKIIHNFSHEKMIDETIKVFELAIIRKKRQE